jgi:hypothetical protein
MGVRASFPAALFLIVMNFRNYVSDDIADKEGLVTVSGESFIIRVDNTTYLSSNGPGRNSVRITSTKQYDTHVSM